MKNLDYYTVMESKIRYYAQKYDPDNRIGQIQARRKILIEPLEPTIEHVRKTDKFRKRILAGFDAVISVFL